VAEIAVGHDHYMARRRDGTIVGWGYDVSGALGDGSEPASSNTLARVSGIDDAIDLDSYSRTVCAVRRGGSVWCWGECAEGQCGSAGAGLEAHVPVRVSGVDDAISVQIGRYAGCALRVSGEVVCWGNDGARGDGVPYQVNAYSTTPVPVPGLTEVESLESSTIATCAIRRGGELWCWGAYAVWRAPEYLTPRRITGLGEVLDVALGNLPGRPFGNEDGVICVLERGNRVRCWGQNRFGQNGDGTTTPSSTPVDVIGLP
jgi:alpha-tubulin suppressor-like RCC1 family protein